MEIPREQVYKKMGQRIAWISHYLKARFKHKGQRQTDILAQFFPANGVVFDVGAHFGYLAKGFCRVHGSSCSVHAFEPVEYTHSILKRVIGRLNNATIVNHALSDTEGEINISIPVKNSGKLGIGLSHFGEERDFDYIIEPIKTMKMDTYVQQKRLDRLDFIKCDVEGAELLVFKGGEKSIDNFKPTIYCELMDSFTRRLGYKAQEVFDFLQPKGYTAYSLSPDGQRKKVFQYSADVEDYLFIAR